MKKHKILSAIFVVLVLLFVGAFVWWNSQVTFLKSINAEDISAIAVFNGNTGARFEIDTKEDISYIVENIQQQSFEKDGVSLFKMGTKFNLSFQDQGGKIVSELTVNGDHTIRKDPFFYETDAGSMQSIIDYLDALENKAPMK